MGLATRILGQNPLRTLRPECIGDRRRLDLMYHNGKLGIRGPSAPNASFDFVEVSNPDSASPAISSMIGEFTSSRFPIDLAQIRFREASNGWQGLWIDTSNEQIKALLEQKSWAQKMLLRGWVIEIGQKHKEIMLDDTGKLALKAAQARPWLSSFDQTNREMPLLSYASLFSQPGPEVNRALISAGMDLLDSQNISKLRWIEWGAGYGNLTAAYASRLGSNAFASELDPAAAACLALNAPSFFPGVLTERAAAEKGPNTSFGEAQLWLIDPPRSGFSELLDRLKLLPSKPRYVLAYHCHEKGLSSDTAKLKEAGYQLTEWSSVDAFPATLHQEVISLWISNTA